MKCPRWFLALAAAACTSAVVAAEVLTIRLPMSNVHLIRGAKPVLVDAGRAEDAPALVAALAAHGVRPAEVALVVLTHGHADHAGGAAALKRAGAAQLALGAGDLPMARAGDHGTLNPMNFTARALKRFAIDPRYEPFEPDLAVERELDLAPWGIAGRVVAMPGHTPGSLVVRLADGSAIVGDQMLGGWLGGALFADRAGPHYFHADRAANETNIGALLGDGVQRFHLGHGGPVTAASVRAGFPEAAAQWPSPR